MLGAIVGDIVGSVYERHNIKTKEFPLFRDDCHFTDDTVMTCAVAEAIMNGEQKDDFIDAIKKYGRKYPNVGYGSRFRKKPVVEFFTAIILCGILEYFSGWYLEMKFHQI